MSTEKLREAARLMRERASSATSSPWTQEPSDGDVWGENNRERVCRTSSYAYYDDSIHIASWHPAVALAVADLLEEAADAFDNHMAKQMDPLRRFHGLWLAEAERKHERALAVASAYLGEPS